MFLKLEQIFTWNYIIYEGSQVNSVCKVFPPLITFWHSYFLIFTAFVCFSTLGKWKVICIWQYIVILLPVQFVLFFTRDNFFLCICIWSTKVIPLTTFPSRLLWRTLVGVWIAFSDSSRSPWMPFTQCYFRTFSYTNIHFQQVKCKTAQSWLGW
jgi:hypothetical protein